VKGNIARIGGQRRARIPGKMGSKMEAEKGVQLSSRKEGVTMTEKGCRWVY
jgi:hypothetical protein